MEKRSIGLLVAILLIWSFPPVLIKYLDFSFSPFTQNFYRYLISALFLLSFEYIFYKKDLLICLKKVKLFLLPALTITLYQTFFTLGIIFSQANTCAFLSKISGVFVILLACLFLPEERSIIREKNFILGFVITFSSTAAITLSKGKVNFSLGSSLLILSMFFWALYTVEIKQILKKTKIKEKITLLQFIAGIFLILGCYFILKASNNAGKERR